MARITVKGCLPYTKTCFKLVIQSAIRARNLTRGKSE
jgi:DNA-directed RNA polymerase subunit K/omega